MIQEKKPVVVHYFTYPDRIGGPLTYIHTLMDSELNRHYDQKTCFQNKAPHGVNLPLLREMTATLRQMKPHIVHIHGVQSEGFYGVLAARLAGCRHIVMTAHGFVHDAAYCNRIKRFLYQYIIEPLALRWSDRVYCVCDFAARREIITRNTGKNNWGYIHNCVPTMHTTCTREQMRRELGLGAQEQVFAISGRVTREKGFDILEKAVEKIEDEHFRLLVIGDGNYRQTFEENMAPQIRSGRVVMVGQTDRVADYLAASDGFIFPTYHENLSIALLEACASGLACVVSNVGGNPEVITDGVNGAVVAGFDPADYARRVTELLRDPERMKLYQQEAKRTAQQRFSKEKMIREVQKVYDSFSPR